MNDYAHGHGSMSISRDSVFTRASELLSAHLSKQYVGSWRDGKRSGGGTCYGSDGSVYEGNWVCDQKSGKGRMLYADGSVYEGEWREDKRDGSGVLLLENGDRYEGEWKADLKHGQGRYVYRSKNRVFEGEWKAGGAHCGAMTDTAEKEDKEHRIPEIGLVDYASVLHDRVQEIREDAIAT